MCMRGRKGRSMRRFWNKDTLWKNGLIFLCAFLSVLSLSHILSLGREALFDQAYFGGNIMSVGLWILDIWMIRRFAEPSPGTYKLYSLLGGIILAASIVYGAYAHFENDIFIDWQTGCLQLLLILGLLPLTAPVSNEILRWMDRFSLYCANVQKEDHVKEGQCRISYNKFGRFCQWLEKRYFLVAWMAIFLAYLPLFLTWWPGNFIYDAKYQIRDVLNGLYHTHHPLLHTWLMGTAYQLGVSWGNPSAGYQLYTILQMLVLSSSFAYCLLYVRKKGLPRFVRGILFAWFALFPMHSLFAITSTKDVLFAAFFLYTAVFFCRLLLDKERFFWYSYVGMILCGTIAVLFRNNAVHALLLFGLCLLVFVKGLSAKLKLLLLIAAIVLSSHVSKELLLWGLDGVEGASHREALTVPFQWMARVANYRQDDIDLEMYDEICMYLYEGDIANYNPYNSDPIRDNVNDALLENNLFNFIKLLGKIVLTYPDECFESIVTNTLGYWYPLPMHDYISMNLALYHTAIETGPEIEKRDYCPVVNGLYDSLFVQQNYKTVPLLGYSFRIAPYVWCLFYIMLWCLLHKNRAGVLAVILPFAYLLTCFLGPVVALRYAYGVIVCCSLLPMILMRQTTEEIEAIK